MSRLSNCKLQLKTGSTYSLVYYSSVTAFVKPTLPMVKNHMMNSSNIFRTITPWKIKILFTLEGIKGRCWWYRILVAWKTFQSLSQNHQPELLDWQRKRGDRERREEETLNINWSEITNLSPFTHHTTQAGDDLYLNITRTTYFIPPLHGLAVCGIIVLNVEENEIHLRRQLGRGGENEGDGGENHHEEREEGVGLHYPCQVSPGGQKMRIICHLSSPRCLRILGQVPQICSQPAVGGLSKILIFQSFFILLLTQIFRFNFL